MSHEDDFTYFDQADEAYDELKECDARMSDIRKFATADYDGLVAARKAITDSVPIIRTFESGAVRDADDGKYDYEGFLSPAVLLAFAEYMHAHRKLADGTYRASDNWQSGIPKDQYLKSLIRHVLDLWLISRTGRSVRPETGEAVSLNETLGGILFNSQGYWHESLKVSEDS